MGHDGMQECDAVNCDGDVSSSRAGKLNAASETKLSGAVHTKTPGTVGSALRDVANGNAVVSAEA